MVYLRGIQNIIKITTQEKLGGFVKIFQVLNRYLMINETVLENNSWL